MENITSWGQFALCLGGALCLIVWAVAYLFRSVINTATTAYGGIIAAQGRRIATLESQLEGVHRQNTQQQRQIDAVEKRVNGGSGHANAT